MKSTTKPSSVSAFVKGGEGKGMWAKRKQHPRRKRIQIVKGEKI